MSSAFIAFIAFIAFFSSLNAQDVKTLMQDYIKASELSNKTKNESAGNLLVYTRDDLERMQALTLKDLLKSLRYFSYSENRLAQSDLLNLDAFSNNSKGIRLYLNEHELQSPLFGSGFVYFGDMELEFIDHVEIYTGFPSFELGIEPATVVIRLYTKTADHDEGGKIKLLGGSGKSHLESAYYSDRHDDLSYFTYVGQYDNNREEYASRLGTVRRDQLRKRFYGSLSAGEHRLEVHAVKSDSDGFMGKFHDAEIVDSSVDYQHLGLSAQSEFMDKSLMLKASYISTETEFEEYFNKPDFSLSGLSAKDKTEEESVTLSVQKKWQLYEHGLSLGLQYRHKYFDISDTNFNGAPVNFVQAYNTEEIYSLYLQDLYALNRENQVIVSVMNQFYQRNGDVNEPDNLQLRLGYIYNDEDISAKTTLSRQLFAAEPYTIISSGYGNVNLKSERYHSFAQEFTYKASSSRHNLLFSYARLSEYPLIGSSGRPENSSKDLDIMTGSYEFSYFYREKDKLELHLNYSHSDTAYTDDSAKAFSSLVRSLNTFGKVDVFNELWLVDPAFESSIRVDYSVGIKYRLTRDFSLSCKGENLFDRAQERAYFDGTDPLTNEEFIVHAGVIDRKIWFGMEYLF